jgi:hypothetical protein
MSDLKEKRTGRPNSQAPSPPKTVGEVFRLVQEGRLTSNQAHQALDRIRRERYSWVERQVSS